MYTQLIWGKGVIVTCKKDCTFFKVGFIGSFHSRLKFLDLGRFFIWQISLI